MKCLICGRVLQNPWSRELGCGPVCYKRVLKDRGIRNRGTVQCADGSCYYNIPGQMRFADYLTDTN